MRSGIYDVSVRSLDELGKRSVVCVDDKDVFDTAAKHPVDIDLSVLDPNDAACSGVDEIVFRACAITEDHNHFIFALGSNNWLKALDPIAENVSSCLRVA